MARQRHRGKRLSAVIGFGLALAGCTAVNVDYSGPITSPTGSKLDTKGLPGIPFYMKRPQVTQQITFLRPWCLVTLSELKEDGTPDPRPAGSWQVTACNAEAVMELGDAVTAGQTEAVIKARIAALPELQGSSPLKGGENWADPELVGRGRTIDWVVDPGTVYYINAPRPLFGQSEFTSQVTESGMLETTTAKSTSGLTEALSELVPLNAYLSHVLDLDKIDAEAMADDGDGAAAPAVQRYALSLEEKGMLFTFTKRDFCVGTDATSGNGESDADSRTTTADPCGAVAAIPSDFGALLDKVEGKSTIGLAQTPWVAPAAKKAEAPTSSKDKNTIELEATLTLPTGADAKD